jgi:hypothetical protein
MVILDVLFKKSYFFTFKAKFIAKISFLVDEKKGFFYKIFYPHILIHESKALLKRNLMVKTKINLEFI